MSYKSIAIDINRKTGWPDEEIAKLIDIEINKYANENKARLVSIVPRVNMLTVSFIATFEVQNQ